MEQYQYRDIGGVPCIVLKPAAEPVGQVVLYHGWGSTIESYKFFASLIAGWRYQVIIPELPWHGERGTLDYKDEASLQSYFWRVVLQGVREGELLVSELSQQSDSRITMIGHSTGGFITAGTFAKVEQVRSAVVINGSCAWVKCEEVYREKLGLGPMEAAEKEAMQKQDPLSYIQPDTVRPLLLLHCEEDTTVPVDSQRFFMEAMSNEGEAPERIQLVEFPGVNHQITLGMLQKIKEFLDSTSTTLR
jgi:pimeloyl-ACP methyl ester carboxylesterase